jgi:hypothetical protein
MWVEKMGTEVALYVVLVMGIPQPIQIDLYIAPLVVTCYYLGCTIGRKMPDVRQALLGASCAAMGLDHGSAHSKSTVDPGKISRKQCGRCETCSEAIGDNSIRLIMPSRPSN